MKMQSIAAAIMNEWWGHYSLGAPSRLSCDSDFSFALVLLSHNHPREAIFLPHATSSNMHAFCFTEQGQTKGYGGY